MPITQDRMLALIAAAQDYRRALTFLVDHILSEDNRASQGELSLQEAYLSIIGAAHIPVLLEHPMDSSATILLEQRHFKHAKARNIRKAEKLRENREALRAGLPLPDRSWAMGAARGTIFPEFHAESAEELDAKRKAWLSDNPQAGASSPTEGPMRGKVEADPNYEEAEVVIDENGESPDSDMDTSLQKD